MITERDLREAIAECEGVRDPTSTTCIKLAAYYTLLDYLYPAPQTPSYSFAEPPKTTYDSGTEFSAAIDGLPTAAVLSVLDEAMTLLKTLNPRFYGAVISQLKEKGR